MAMSSMSKERLDELLEQRRAEHEAWNAAIVPRSKGAKKRAEAEWEILAGPIGMRGVWKYLKRGIALQHVPKQALHVRRKK